MATRNELVQAVALLRAEFDDMQVFDEVRLGMWWKALQHFPDGLILRAAERHLTTSQFKPKLADIVQGCAAQLDGNWLGADEAWALMPKSENDSAMLTDEIAQAIAAATPLLEGRDKVAARMAFKDAYNRLVEKAKIEGRSPRFFPSFGVDPVGRVTMLATAVRAGQITLEKATAALPEYGRDIVKMVGVTSHPLLAGPSQADKDRLKALLLTMKDMNP